MSMSEAELGGSSFSEVVGKKDAIRTNIVTMRIVSIKHAIARNQNPANPGRAGNLESSEIAGITSVDCVLCGTYTGPIWPTFTGFSH